MDWLGYERLASKLPGNKGFDGVYVKFDSLGNLVDLVITESKFRVDGVASLGKQMRDGWILGNIAKMRASTDPTLKAVGEFLNAHQSSIRLKVNVMDGQGLNLFSRVPLPPNARFNR